ncbi:MAG: fumarylacetoacetate hydrolase [Rhodocyclaceae bacterium]|nr:fumarylacetoacetate hydrolase [Rhodocyclaceae bacterium]
MNPGLDETHAPGLMSWVESANDPATDFPIQNLPLGRFRRAGDGTWRIGAAIGDQVVDLAQAGMVATADMNEFLATGRETRRALRLALSRGLRHGSPDESALRRALAPQARVEMGLPCRIGDYTDFYTGIHHARTVGSLFRPDNPLLPNYKWVPIGYHGRASSIIASGQAFRRPRGQTKAPAAPAPDFGPSQRLDYELEVGALIAVPNALGSPVPMAEAEAHVGGLVLVNDWSARDIQAWEYQPLGPFLAKSFATTLSPWIVTLEALQPFRAPFQRPPGDPDPLPYLDSPSNRTAGSLAITLEVWLQTAAMKAAGNPGQRLMTSDFRDAAYWTLAQLVAHHTVNGCNLQSGDLLGSGTLSGPAADQGGSLLELTRGGSQALRLANSETRTFLEDGDTVILRGYCEGPGRRRIGFGDCAGTVLPAAKLG